MAASILHKKSDNRNLGKNPVLHLERNKTYVFNQTNSSNDNHPLRFYSTNTNDPASLIYQIESYNDDANLVAFTTNCYNDTDSIWYHCANHQNMGNQIFLSPCQCDLSPDVGNNNTKLKEAVDHYIEHRWDEPCYEEINKWDVSQITDMSGLFEYGETFNGAIGDWTVNNVTDMKHMFKYAQNFNQDISVIGM